MACMETGNSSDSPRFSFSVNLSPTDRTSPEKRKREDASDENYSTEFEFSILGNVNVGGDEIFGETLISADELFVDGKIMPQIRSLQPQAMRIVRHRSLRGFRCPSPAGSASYSPSKPENSVSKSGHKLSAWWKEIFKLRNKEQFCKSAEAGNDAEDSSNVKPRRSGRFVWLFSKSGGKNGLFCVFPFSRSKSVVESKLEPSCEASCDRRESVGDQSTFKETRSPFPGSKPAETDALKHAGLMSATKGPQELPNSKGGPRKLVRRSPARNYGRGRPGRFVVRNLERCGGKGFDSPRPVRQMAEGLLKSNCNDSEAKMNPVLNMPAFMCPFGGRNGASLFGFTAFFSKKENKTPHQVDYSLPKKGA